MGLILRPGVSFCEVDGTAIFLDVTADRYFCLSGRASQALLSFCSDPNLTIGPEWPAFGLVHDGILLLTPEPRAPRSCAARSAGASLLEQTTPSSSTVAVSEALYRRVVAELALKRSSLAAQIAIVEQRRVRCDADDAPSVAANASAAFAAAALWRSRNQRCLSISFATMAWLARRHCPARLMFGVKLHPFQAHCWVKSAGFLVNDRTDAVRNFTPILVV